MPEPLMEGYKELWGAVLMQIINDALKPAMSSKDCRRAHRAAIDWLNRPDENFALVCTFAGFDPVAVYQAWKGGRIKYVGQKQKRNPRQPGVSHRAQPEHEKGAVQRSQRQAPLDVGGISSAKPVARPGHGRREAAE